MKTRTIHAHLTETSDEVIIHVGPTGSIEVQYKDGRFTKLSMLDEEEQNEVFIQIVNSQRPMMYRVTYF
jgi:hypothetical protein